MRKYNYPDENGLEKTLKNIQYSASIFILLQGLQTISVVTLASNIWQKNQLEAFSG